MSIEGRATDRSADERVQALEEELILTRLELAKVRADLEEVGEKAGKARRSRVKADREADLLAKALADALIRETRRRLRAARWMRAVDRQLPSPAEWAQVNLLRQSQYFWPGWYLRRNLDVAEAGVEPALHFLRNGYRENRDPSPNFSLRKYLKRHRRDVGGGNPLLHAIQNGKAPAVKIKRKKIHS